MDKVIELLPSCIEDALTEPPVSMLAKVVPQKNIEAFLAIELTKLQSMVNVDQRLNLQAHQIPLIANYLITTFKNENLADFVICFRNGAMGKYDEKLLRLDGAVISQWMYKYLDEKYEAVEAKLMREKDNPYARPDKPSNESDRWFEIWKQSIGYVEEKKGNEFVNALEREKIGRQSLDADQLKRRELHMEWIKDNYTKEGQKKPEYMEEAEWLNANGYFDVKGKLIEAESQEQAIEIYSNSIK